MQLNNNKNKHWIKKHAEDLNRHFSEEDIQINKRYVKRFLTSLTVRNEYIFSSVTQPCPTLCDPMGCSTPGPPVHHQLPEFTQTHARWDGGYRSQAPAARDSTWREEWCRRVMRQPLSFLGLPIYFKFKIFFYTFTKWSEVWHFQFPLTQIYYVHKSLFLFRVPASVILWESALPSFIYFL